MPHHTYIQYVGLCLGCISCMLTRPSHFFGEYAHFTLQSDGYLVVACAMHLETRL